MPRWRRRWDTFFLICQDELRKIEKRKFPFRKRVHRSESQHRKATF